jgi:DNA-binding NarL/FixJ family response regulator
MRNGARGFVGKSAGANELLQGIKIVLKGDTYLSQTDFNKFSDVIQSSTNYFTKQNVDLSELEKTFLNWCCTNLNYAEIATKMFISPRTASDYRDRLFKKIGVNSRQELAVYAVQNKLLQ